MREQQLIVFSFPFEKDEHSNVRKQVHDYHIITQKHNTNERFHCKPEGKLMTLT